MDIYHDPIQRSEQQKLSWEGCGEDLFHPKAGKEDRSIREPGVRQMQIKLLPWRGRYMVDDFRLVILLLMFWFSHMWNGPSVKWYYSRQCFWMMQSIRMGVKLPFKSLPIFLMSFLLLCLSFDLMLPPLHLKVSPPSCPPPRKPLPSMSTSVHDPVPFWPSMSSDVLVFYPSVPQPHSGCLKIPYWWIGWFSNEKCLNFEAESTMTKSLDPKSNSITGFTSLSLSSHNFWECFFHL